MNKSHWILVVNTFNFAYTLHILHTVWQMIDMLESKMIHLNPLVPTELSSDVLSGTYDLNNAHILSLNL